MASGTRGVRAEHGGYLAVTALEEREEDFLVPPNVARGRRLRRAGAASFLAAALFAAYAAAHGRPTQERGPSSRHFKEVPDAPVRPRSTLEFMACDCKWASKPACSSDDGGSCWEQCCSEFKEGDVDVDASRDDGGLSACKTVCGCKWANKFVCMNNGGNCCANFCCAPYKAGKLSTTPTTTMAPKKCDRCECDCSWVHKFKCEYGHEDTCCGNCCCGSNHTQPVRRPSTTFPVSTTSYTGRVDHKGFLFCFLLMLPPPSYEVGLVKLQLERGVGIFACDRPAVYSNKTLELGKNVSSTKVDSNLTCRVGGEFRTALNLGIFMEVWRKVVRDGDFRQFDWTVKVDADSVFMPGRLRTALAEYHGGSRKEYLNNCKRGLHGPIEVLSSSAVEAWASGMDYCVEYFEKLCSGPCYWGEDMFLDQCFIRVLKVRRNAAYSLLSEEHCDPAKHWDWCSDPASVAFHPFKGQEAWLGCFANASHQHKE